MGNFHCIPNGCARVVYREYLPPSIRYRYEGEDWQHVDGDDYAIEESLGGQREGVRYIVHVYIKKENEASKISTVYLTGRIGDFLYIFGGVYGGRNYYYVRLLHTSGQHNHPIEVCYTDRGVEPPGNNIFRIENIFPKDNPECIFTVYQNGQIVHQETRDTCPEVEKLDCRLSDVSKEIKIDKTPWLSSIQVIDFARDSFQQPGVPFPLPDVRPIPDECWNIYRQEIFDFLPDGNTTDEPNQPVFGDYIAQICSASGCPRPEYQVICDCDCRECPPNTCAVACDGHVCCYDTSTGMAVESIPIVEYCGGIK